MTGRTISHYNGSGRIRGIYCQSNAAVKPIFEEWMKPFAESHRGPRPGPDQNCPPLRLSSFRRSPSTRWFLYRGSSRGTVRPS